MLIIITYKFNKKMILVFKNKNILLNMIILLKIKKEFLSSQYGIGGTNITMISSNESISYLSINSPRKHFRIRFNTIPKNKY